MRRVTLRGLAARRGRAALTALSVLVGVAMIAGTLAFTDAVRGAFRDLFTASASGADVVVSARQDTSAGLGAGRGVAPAVQARLRRIPGVAQAAGQVTGTATVRGRDGAVIRRGGLPTVGLSYLPPPFQNLRILAGRAPAGIGEVVLDDETARRGGYRLGDLVPVTTETPERRFRLVGIARFGSRVAGDGGISSPFAAFDLASAERLYDRAGSVDFLSLAARPGVRPVDLVRRVAAVLPPELLARTAAGEVDANARQVGSRLSVLTTGLIAFALVAVLVGAFVIFNTFSITLAQRRRELALLRIVGAARRQILGSVLTEALVVGLAAGALGLVAGLAAARAIRGLFAALGFDLPTAAIVLSGRTVLVSLGAGTLTALVAALVPALRATRVLPLEALRSAAGARVRRRRWPAAVAALALGGAGLGGLLYGSSATDASANARLGASAGGALVIVLGLAFLTPPAVRPAVRLLGAPFARGNRLVGRLARENAARNPARTAASASALMVGLALVLFVTIFASGLRQASAAIIDRTFGGDFAIVNVDGFSPIPAAAARVAALTGGVRTISSLKPGQASLGRLRDVPVTGIDASTISDVYHFDWIDGSDRVLHSLGLDDALIEREAARRAHLAVGDRVRLITSSGAARTVTVRGIYHDDALLEGFVIPAALHDRLFSSRTLSSVLVRLAPGASRTAAAADLRQGLAAFPDVRARSQQQLKADLGARVDRVLALFSTLLGMSVLVALLGLLATLSLSVYERTGELGLVRIVGMPRMDVRRMVRYESLITAGLGAVLGVVLGLFLAWATTLALRDEGLVYSVPWLAVAACVAVALAAGALAAVPPARRASRLEPLEALGLG